MLLAAMLLSLLFVILLPTFGLGVLAFLVGSGLVSWARASAVRVASPHPPPQPEDASRGGHCS
jgi:hypothetical protein